MFKNQGRWGFIKLGYALLVLSFLGLSFCNKKDDAAAESIEDNVSAVIDSALGEINSSASSGEGSAGFLSLSARPLATCSSSDLRTACAAVSGGSGAYYRTLDYNSCTQRTATVDGTMIEVWAGTGASSCALSGDGAVLLRSISSSDPKIITFASGATLTVDNEPGTAFDGTTFSSSDSGTQITRLSGSSTTSNGLTCATGTPCLRVQMQGLHRTLKGPRGRTFFEHILTSDVSMQGTKAAGTRVSSGTVTVWHELLEYKAVNTLSSVTWGDASCNFPTSGSVSSTFTGSVTGTATTTFTTTCGEATFVNPDGETSTITLSQEL